MDGWHWTDTAVHAELEVLQLKHGAIVIPPNISHVVVEIGANGHHWLWNEPLPVAVPGVPLGSRIKDLPNVLLISFEPLLDKYARYLSFQSVGEVPATPGWSVPDRAIVLPFAVGAPEGSSQFHVSQMDGCSSMLPVSQQALRGPWSDENWFMFKFCASVNHASPQRRVPIVSLDTVLSRWLNGRKVSFVKIDAQSYDLRVVRSGRQQLLGGQVYAAQLEITADHCHPGYIGGHLCTETVDGMAELGFETAANCSNPRRFRNKGCASDFIFYRQGGEALDGKPVQFAGRL